MSSIRNRRSPFRRHILGVKKTPTGSTCPNEPQCQHSNLVHLKGICQAPDCACAPEEET